MGFVSPHQLHFPSCSRTPGCPLRTASGDVCAQLSGQQAAGSASVPCISTISGILSLAGATSAEEMLPPPPSCLSPSPLRLRRGRLHSWHAGIRGHSGHRGSPCAGASLPSTGPEIRSISPPPAPWLGPNAHHTVRLEKPFEITQSRGFALMAPGRYSRGFWGQVGGQGVCQGCRSLL